MKTPEEFISDNGYGKGSNFTVGIVAFLMKQYTLSLLPSDDEIKKQPVLIEVKEIIMN